MSPILSWPVARTTFRERGLAPSTIALAVLLVLISVGVSSQNPLFRFLFNGPFLVLTIMLGGGLLASEVESGHAQLVLLRPVTRAQWVGGRFAGAAAALTAVALTCALAGSIAAAVRPEFISPAIPIAWSWVPAMAWLATLLAIGAATPGWTNAGLAVAAYVVWNLVRIVLLTAQPGLAAALALIDAYFGPQDLVKFPIGTSFSERALWDAAWFFAAWLVAVNIFNGRELARRRA